MSHPRALAALAGCIVLVTGVATAQHHGHQAHHGHGDTAKDARMLVPFPPEMAAHILANMRDHLHALQEISEALSRGQHEKAAKVAEERLGMSSLKAHGAHEAAKHMPQGMQDAGSSMHRAASRFSLEAQNAAVTGDLKPALGVLAEVMNACVSCHASYRLK